MTQKRMDVDPGERMRTLPHRHSPDGELCTDPICFTEAGPWSYQCRAMKVLPEDEFELVKDMNAVDRAYAYTLCFDSWGRFSCYHSQMDGPHCEPKPYEEVRNAILGSERSLREHDGGGEEGGVQ